MQINKEKNYLAVFMRVLRPPAYDPHIDTQRYPLAWHIFNKFKKIEYAGEKEKADAVSRLNKRINRELKLDSENGDDRFQYKIVEVREIFIYTDLTEENL